MKRILVLVCVLLVAGPHLRFPNSRPQNQHPERFPRFSRGPSPFVAPLAHLQHGQAARSQPIQGLQTSCLKENRPMPNDKPLLDSVPDQVFTLPSGESHWIELAGGTRVGIPAFPVVCEGKVVEGPLEWTIREYCDLRHFLADHVFTQSGETHLETAGSLKIEATYQGKACQLQEGRSLRLAFPREKAKPGMKTYYGIEEHGRVDWQASTLLARDAELQAPPLPLQKAGALETEKLQGYLFHHMPCPPFLRQFTLKGDMEVTLHQQEDGCFASACIRESVHPLFDRALVLALQRCPFPIGTGGRTESRVFTIPIWQQTANPFDHNATRDRQYERALSQQTVSYCPVEKPTGDFARRPQENSIPDFLQDSRGLSYLFITSTRLGYINCDREIPVEGPTQNLVVKMEDVDNPVVFLVYRNRRSVIGARVQGKRHLFRNVSMEDSVEIVGLSRSKGEIYLACLPLSVGDKKKIYLNPQRVTETEFKERLAVKAQEFARL